MGEGVVRIKDFKKYHLPAPMEIPGRPSFSIAVTHQLHCLVCCSTHTKLLVLLTELKHSIMASYSLLSRKNTSSGPSLSEIEDIERQYWHIDHCFDYLRQSLMCCGDTALEGGATVFPGEVIGTDGWGAQHICKNYDDIFKWAEVRRTVDERHL